MSLITSLLLGCVIHSAPVIGDQLKPFDIETSKGVPFSWHPKRVTVISCCAFWCDTWKDQLPRVKEASQQLRGLPVDFLTVSVDGRWSERGKTAAVGRNLSDRGSQWTRSVGIDRVPYTLLVDPSGTIRWASYGVVRSQDLVAATRAALQPNQGAGNVYLTFDDFPAEHGNDELLDVLRAAHVKAAFFCVCSRASKFPAIMKRAVAEGHRLEIHAWDHDERQVNLNRCSQALTRFGPAPDLFRPAGSETIFTLDHRPLRFHVADPYDFKRPGPDELIRRVSHLIEGGGVIQLHAGVSDSIAALPSIIDKLTRRGMRFQLLSHESIN